MFWVGRLDPKRRNCLLLHEQSAKCKEPVQLRELATVICRLYPDSIWDIMPCRPVGFSDVSEELYRLFAGCLFGIKFGSGNNVELFV
jgi:hypothetical protein